MNKKNIVAGNWKMNKTSSEGRRFIRDVQNIIKDIHGTEIIFFPAFTSLHNAQLKYPFHLGAQNCHWETSGAFTGEVSIEMLIEYNVKYVLVGHSERRQLFNETDAVINQKIRSIDSSKLKPILCIGETIEDRESGLTEDFLNGQLVRNLEGIKSIENFVIAYEPIWAIGTGETANKEQIYKAHNFIKSVLKKLYPDTNNCPILYGGSVSTKNAKELIQITGVDGFLIGGASLSQDSFVSIINDVENFRSKI